MAKLRKNHTLHDVIAAHPDAGLPLFDHAVAAQARRYVPTGDSTRDASFRLILLGEITESQRLIYRSIERAGPASDREISLELAIPINRVTPRRGELLELGLIERAGETFDAETKRNVATWRAL